MHSGLGKPLGPGLAVAFHYSYYYRLSFYPVVTYFVNLSICYFSFLFLLSYYFSFDIYIDSFSLQPIHFLKIFCAHLPCSNLLSFIFVNFIKSYVVFISVYSFSICFVDT